MQNRCAHKNDRVTRDYEDRKPRGKSSIFRRGFAPVADAQGDDATQKQTLSAIGSRYTPSVLRWLYCRATYPSRPSLAAARIKMTIAAKRCHSSGLPRLILSP